MTDVLTFKIVACHAKNYISARIQSVTSYLNFVKNTNIIDKVLRISYYNKTWSDLVLQELL